MDVLGIFGNVAQMLRACFRAGEPVLLDLSGKAKPIEEIQEGDFVLSGSEFDPTGPLEPKRVEEKFVRVAEVMEVVVRGRVIGTTGEHPFYVYEKGWVAAHDLKPGDQFRSHDGQWIAVEATRHTGKFETVYNFRVADWHTYFVGSSEWGFSVWAHNTYNKNFDNTNFGQRVAANMKAGTIGKYWNILGDYAQAVASNVLTGFGATVRNVSRTVGSAADLIARRAGAIANIEAKFSLPAVAGTAKFNRLAEQMIAGVKMAQETGGQFVVWSLRRPSVATLNRYRNAVGPEVFNQTQFVDGAKGLYKWATFFFR